MNKKILFFLCLILFIVSIAGVSAADDANQTTDDDVLSISQNDCEIQESASDGTFSTLQTMIDETDENNIINSQNDYNDFVGNVNNVSFNDIQNLIDNANSGDVIVLDGYYSGSGSEISINKPVTIVGVNDTVLDAKGLSRIFYVSASNVHIENINFINGYAGWDGGAIRWSGDSGVLINSTFINNIAGWGGAIFWWASNGYLSDCVFINNTASDYGGALYVNGRNLRMLSSVYVNNVVTNSITQWQGGGAIYTDLTPDTAEDCHIVANSTFISNKAINSWGGALKLGSGTAIFDSNEFYDNFALKGTSIYLGKVKDPTNNRFYLNSIDEISSCVEGVNLSTIFDLNTFFVNGNIVSKNSYFNNETKSYTFLTAANVIADYHSGTRLVATLRDVNGNALSNEMVGFTVNGKTWQFATNDNGVVRFSTDRFDVGDYTVLISYDGNELYYPSNTTANILIRAGTVLTAADVIADYHSGTRLVATLRDVNGNALSNEMVGFTVNGKKWQFATNDNGVVRFSTDRFDGGNYTVLISYEGNELYSPSSTTANIFIRAGTVLTAADVIADYHSGTRLVATLRDSNGNALSNEKVSFTVNGKKWQFATNANGVARFSTDRFDGGNYTVLISYEGNELYSPSSTTANILIKICTSLSASNLTTVYGSGDAFVVTLKDANDNPISDVDVVVELNGINYTLTAVDGNVQLPVGDLAPGYYTAIFSFAGTDFYLPSNATADVTVNKATSQLSVSNIYIKYGESGSLPVTLKDSNGNPIGHVIINVEFNDETYKLLTDYKGKATLPVDSLTPGYYTATFNFAGNDFYTSSSTTGHVDAHKIYTMLMSSSVTATYGTTNYLIATLTASPTGGVDSFTPLSGQPVVFRINGVEYTVTTGNNGQAKFNTNGLLPGQYTATVLYSGNSLYESTYCINEQGYYLEPTIVINKANPTITTTGVTTTYGTEQFVTAILKDHNGNVMANRLVSFNFEDGTGRTVLTDNNGKAQLSTLGINAGTHTISVTYAPSSASDDYNKYNSVSSSVTMKINKADAILYAKSGNTWIVNKKGQNVNSFSLQSDKEKEIQIYVEDSNGNPVVGTTVRLEGNSYASTKSVTTDSSGIARFTQKFHHTASIVFPQAKTFSETFTLVDNNYNTVSITVNVSVSGN